MDIQHFEAFKQIQLDRLVTETGDVGVSALKSLAGLINCEWATYWKVDPLSQSLKPFCYWASDPSRVVRLEQHTVTRALSLSEGTAGQVWRNQKLVWSQNIVGDMCLPRSLDATAAGFSAGIWFAVQTPHAVYGVVELLGKNIPSGTDAWKIIVERIGFAMGESIRAVVDAQERGESDRNLG